MPPSRALSAPHQTTPVVPLEALLARARAYAEASLAPSTRRAYERDFRTFAQWCVGRGERPLPVSPVLVAAFLAAEAEREFRPVTIARRASAIAWVHRSHDAPNPCDSAVVRSVLAGIRREHGAAALRRVRPLEVEPLGRVLESLPADTLAGLRDRGLILLGFAAALRRSELAALDVGDLEFDPSRGLLVMLRRSKTDQERLGERVAVPYAREPERCAVRAVRRWLDAAGIHMGPVFRRMHRGDHLGRSRLSDQSVALVMKRRAAAAGLSPGQLAGHSLRAGYVTSAARAGVEERKIANVSRHNASEGSGDEHGLAPSLLSDRLVGSKGTVAVGAA